MSDQKKTQAREVYDILCEVFERNGWPYEQDDAELTVRFDVQDDEIAGEFFMTVDAQRQMIRLLSPLPFCMSQEKRIEGAIAVCAASYGMADGSFDYDLADGSITFRMNASFQANQIGEGLIRYMVSWATTTVYDYSLRFRDLAQGVLSLSDFLERETAPAQPAEKPEAAADKRARYPEEARLTLDFTDGPGIECGIMGVFEVEGVTYIALDALDDSDRAFLYQFVPKAEGFELLDIPDEIFGQVNAEFERLLASHG